MDVEGAVTAGTWLRLNNSTTGGNNWNLISSGSGNGEGAGKLIFNDQTGGSVGDVMVLDPAGKVGVAQVPATNALEVNGNASKTTAGSWLANSDRRIKLDIRTIDHALETLDRVRLVDFRYTPEYRAMHPSLVDRRYLNVIAQEFAQVFPDWVKGSGEKLADGSEILQVDTYPLTIYAAAAVQELHAKLKEKDNEIAALKARVNVQEKEIAALTRQQNAQSEKDREIESRLSRLEKMLPSSAGIPVLLKIAAPRPETN